MFNYKLFLFLSQSEATSGRIPSKKINVRNPHTFHVNFTGIMEYP